MSVLARRIAPEPVTRARWILLASEGRPFSASALDRVRQLADGPGTYVRVFAIARVHGTSLGLPNPGLLPTKAEWEEQRRSVASTVARLRREGFRATGEVIGTRKGAQRICQEAERCGAQVIVMSADADRNLVVGELMWSQEPQRVKRMAPVAVDLVVEGSVGDRMRRP